MNYAETHALLTTIATLDNRRFDDVTVLAWQPLMADVGYDDALGAVRKHFTTSADYLMPVHVIRGAADIDRDRRRRARELRERAEQLAIEADPTRRDRSNEVQALIAELRDRLPEGDPDKLRRAEWLEVDRRRDRIEEPNPHYTGPPPPDGWPLPDEDADRKARA